MIKLLAPLVCAAALTGGTLSLYAPRIDLARLNADLTAFSATSVAFINKALTPVKPEAAPLDPVAAANVNEDLDYRIAQQTKSGEGWRAFLAAHPHGAHAPAAQAELNRLEPPPPPPSVPTVAKLTTPSQQLESFQPVERQSAEAPEPQTKTTVVEVPKTIPHTLAKKRERRVVHARVARPRRQAEQSSLPPFLLALFGDRRARGGKR